MRHTGTCQYCGLSLEEGSTCGSCARLEDEVDTVLDRYGNAAFGPARHFSELARMKPWARREYFATRLATLRVRFDEAERLLAQHDAERALVSHGVRISPVGPKQGS